MINLVFAVHDAKAGAYLRPFHMNSKGEAVRAWVDVVNDPKTQFNKHPEDFRLFQIAKYDDISGEFQNLETPEDCGYAKEFVRGE